MNRAEAPPARLPAAADGGYRNPNAPGEAKLIACVLVRLSAADHEAVVRAAAAAGMRPAGFLRYLVRRALKG